MRPELQAKLLQHLNKKKADKGFTLVELLVVIVIIGILTAIALPSFLNQTAKAKQSEAKQNVSSVIKAQQSFRTENAVFTTAFNDLALGTLRGAAGDVSSTTVFNYTLLSAIPANEVSITADTNDIAVKAYSGRTQVDNVAAAAGTQIAWTSIICEAQEAPGPSGAGPTALGAPTTTVAVAGAAGARSTCAGTTGLSYAVQ
jgi:type IV pilus assembly protein PilA